MQEEQIKKILNQLPDRSIGVIGDFFLDKHLLIDPIRDEPSLETGLTAYQVVQKRLSPGAAGTVTNNLKALRVGKVTALGVIGKDGEGFELAKGLGETGVDTSCLIHTSDRVTPTYIKPMLMLSEGEREINRLDIKNWTETPTWLEEQIIDNLYRMADRVDAIIALDQVIEENFGVITSRIRKALAEIGNQKKDLIIYADSRAHIAAFQNVMVKCNHYEVVKMIRPDFVGEPEEALIESCGKILSLKTQKPVFITWGAQGQFVIEDGRLTKVPAFMVQGPIDTCGAGDATTSGTVAALCCGTGLADAAFFGNLISSITIQQIGVTGMVTPDQVLDRYYEY